MVLPSLLRDAYAGVDYSVLQNTMYVLTFVNDKEFSVKLIVLIKNTSYSSVFTSKTFPFTRALSKILDSSYMDRSKRAVTITPLYLSISNRTSVCHKNLIVYSFMNQCWFA